MTVGGKTVLGFFKSLIGKFTKPLHPPFTVAIVECICTIEIYPLDHEVPQFISAVIMSLQELKYLVNNNLIHGNFPIVSKLDIGEMDKAIDEYALSIQSK